MSHQGNTQPNREEFCLDVDETSYNTDERTTFPRIYHDTVSGEPIALTEDEFNNLVELFRELASIRDRGKTPK